MSASTLWIGVGKTPPRPYTLADFYEQTTLLPGGHRRWLGRHSRQGVPLTGRTESVYRLSFRLTYDREPDGYVRGTCTLKHCVAGEHLADRIMRQSGNAGAEVATQ
ncbi:hypothetical protein ACFY64_31470 [Streptomyces collinus]|uniref:hypothetical protein n=1 Tax=Streptomyces collinus TaxID=42684 RepID=UPI0036856D6B